MHTISYHPYFTQVSLAILALQGPILRPRLAFMLEIGGAAKHDRAESIHRPLHLTAMVLANPTTKQRLVLIEGDLSWWRGLENWKSLQASLLEATGLPSE